MLKWNLGTVFVFVFIFYRYLPVLFFSFSGSNLIQLWSSSWAIRCHIFCCLTSSIQTLFTRPGVARAVLQSLPSLTNWLIHSLSHPIVQISSKVCQPQTARPVDRMFIPNFASCVTYHVLRVMCHLSPVTGHLSPVTYNLIFFLIFSNTKKYK